MERRARLSSGTRRERNTRTNPMRSFVRDGFSEHELAHKIYKYGNVATVFSSHEVSVASCIHGVSTSISFTTLGTDGGFPLYLGTLRTTSMRFLVS